MKNKALSEEKVRALLKGIITGENCPCNLGGGGCCPLGSNSCPKTFNCESKECIDYSIERLK